MTCYSRVAGPFFQQAPAAPSIATRRGAITSAANATAAGVRARALAARSARKHYKPATGAPEAAQLSIRQENVGEENITDLMRILFSSPIFLSGAIALRCYCHNR
jgi:hypothetical protein